MHRFFTLSALLPLLLLLVTDTEAPASAPATEVSHPGDLRIHVEAARLIPAELSGPERAVAHLRARDAAPLSMATADFDEDGVPDVVCGYESGGKGILTLHRGDIDAIQPNAPEARARRTRGESTGEAFHPGVRVFEMPGAPDFLAAGDFDADGHQDLAAASRGNARIEWRRGDGRGGLGPVHRLDLPGRATVLVSGEINRRDGLEDLVLGVDGGNAPQVLVFEAPEGALQRPPETVPLPAPADALVLGQLDRDPARDLLVAAGKSLVYVQGRDRRLSLAPPGTPPAPAAIAERLALPFKATSLALGRFDAKLFPEAAILSDTGFVHIAPVGAILDAAHGGVRADELFASPQATGVSRARLIAADVSSHPGVELLVLDLETGRARALLLDQAADEPTATSAIPEAAPSRRPRRSVSIPLEGSIAAILPMRVNDDAMEDLVGLSQSSGSLVVLPTDVPTTFFVTNTDDAGPGSLRQAILDANLNDAADRIEFQIPGPGVHVIQPLTELPLINGPTTIDGESQPGFAGTPMVVLDGALASVFGESQQGLSFRMGPSVLQGLSIVNFDITGGSAGVYVELNLPSTLLLRRNFIGVLPNGLAAPNLMGIDILSGGSDIFIGGTAPAFRNVISANRFAGIFCGPGSVAILGNHLGTDPIGLASYSPEGSGVRAGIGCDVVIGSTAAGAGNLIAGNMNGISIQLGAHPALVQGNLIGTDVTGMHALGNAFEGIFAADDSGTIGGTSPGARNVISGNKDGVALFGAGWVVQGNRIGLGSDGSAIVGNRESGIEFRSGRQNQIGGTVAGSGNVISGNAEGVSIHGSDVRAAELNTLAGNLIGTDASGMSARPNQQGILIGPQAAINTIGTEGGENVISGNALAGVLLRGPDVYGNWIKANRIGVATDTSSPLGNGADGIRIEEGAEANLLGGVTPSEQNVIAHNAGAGMAASGDAGGDNVILINSTYDNAGLGIDLWPPGVNINDPQDPDSGPNELQNFPVLSLAASTGGSLRVEGTLDSLPNSDFTIRVYSSPDCDASGHGEGAIHLGSFLATTDAFGAATFSATLPAAVAFGDAVTATASLASNTSEFSACSEAHGVPPEAIEDLRFDSARPERLVWDAEPGAILYNVYIGTFPTIPEVVSPISDSCLAGSLPETGGTLPVGSNPPPGQLIWFMVTASNQFGEGGVQPATQGPRQLNSTGACGDSCAHDMCSTGGALEPACTLCASIVCSKDPHCCAQPNGTWDFQCVQQVRTVCRSLSCAESQGQCPHKLCDPEGGPLPPGCDSPPLAVSCTAAVCQADPHCCQQAWDEACIAKMETVCGYSCL